MATTPMTNAQMATITETPDNAQGAATPLPAGLISYAAVPGTAVSLAPSVDSLSCLVSGIAGQTGTEVVTASFTNPDGTVATPDVQTFVVTAAVSPVVDVTSLVGTVSTPVAQGAPVASAAVRSAVKRP